MALAVALTVSGLGVALAGSPAQAAVLPYQDATLPTATRVADLLGRMTLDDKIGQMTQAERAVVSPSDLTTYRLGSVLSGGGSAPSSNTTSGWADLYDGLQRGALATPLQIPMLYGIDAVHGNNNALGATIFPHNIGLGATRDPELAQEIGRAVAEEVSATGVDWTFAPCLCVARNDRWGRTYESFGEDPAIPSSMTTIVTGFQGERLGGPASVLATAKHYIGDGGTADGDDQGNTRISEAELRAIHLPPFKAAIAKGVGSVMMSYSSWNGVKMHGNKYLLTDVLKGELGFTRLRGVRLGGDRPARRRPGLHGPGGRHVDQRRHRHGDGAERLQDVPELPAPGRAERRRSRPPASTTPCAASSPRSSSWACSRSPTPTAPTPPPSAAPRTARSPARRCGSRRCMLKNTRRPAAGDDRRQDLRGRQERRRHRQPERRLDADLAGRERRDRARDDDPAGHPAGRWRAVAR